MTGTTSSPVVWLVDPISYSGLAYTDVGQILALQQLGVRPVLVGSDSWMLDPEMVPRVTVFRGTSGNRSRSRRGVAYVRSLARLLIRVRRYRPDVVHWQFTELPVADALTMVAIRLLGINQVYTAHELLPWSARRHHRWLFTRIYRIVDAVVVHSEDQRVEIIRRFRVPPSRVYVAPLGDYARFATPDLDGAVAREKLALPADAPVALFFGTIRPSKGLEVLLEAWPLVLQKVPEAILVVTGKPYKGLDTEKTVAFVNELGIDASVRMRFEHVDPAEANTYYRAADVVVLPYHEIGTSGVLRYAYNSARPVIATSVGEHGSHVIEGQTGHLVPPRNPAALASALVRVLADRPSAATMGAGAHAYAVANMSWLGPARHLLRLYESLGHRE